MPSLADLLLLCMVAGVFGAQCPKTCTRQERYDTRCGLFGWGRCASYRTVSYTCYNYCLHGGWSEYTLKEEGPCNVSCGGGKKSVKYQRTCSSPAPYNGGNACQGESEKEEQQACNTHECPIDGGWSQYVIDSVEDCSKTCDSGTQQTKYVRSCTNPPPKYGGRACQGALVQLRFLPCNTYPCPIDGGWSDFTEWKDHDECSALCGEGQKNQIRTRTCTNPEPAFGGRDCDGLEKENQTVSCNKKECGDRCPTNQVTFIPHTNNPRRYYQCDNGVARLRTCQEETRWDQNSTACVHSLDQTASVLRASDACDSTTFYNKHPDCTKFIMCVNGRSQEMSCPPGTRFSYGMSACDMADNVPCSTA